MLDAQAHDFQGCSSCMYIITEDVTWQLMATQDIRAAPYSILGNVVIYCI